MQVNEYKRGMRFGIIAGITISLVLRWTLEMGYSLAGPIGGTIASGAVVVAVLYLLNKTPRKNGGDHV